MCSTVISDRHPGDSINISTSISELIGEWGKWQQQTVFFIFLCKIPAAWFMACLIFTAPIATNDEFHCSEVVSEYQSTENVIKWSNIVKTMKQSDNVDSCMIYKNSTVDDDWQKQDVIVPKSFNIKPCTIFEHQSPFHSLVTQYDLICTRTIWIAVTQFFHLCGVLTGGIFATKLLEFISPRNVMLIGMITQIISGCLTGIVNDFNLHMFFRYLAAVCCSLMYTPGLMIFADITGGKYRKSVICLFESFWGVGIILLPMIANWLPQWNWTTIYFAISLPTILYILVWFFIPDSPKWLLAHGEINAAKNQLFYAIRVNKRSAYLPKNIDSFLQLEASASLKTPKPDTWTSLWSSKIQIILMIALHIAWAADVTNYNGMLLNIRVFGREFLIINTIICGICEIVGILIAWLIIMHCQNHPFLCSGLFNIIAGMLSFLGFAFPTTLTDTEYVTLGMTLAMISKIATTCSQAVLFTCTCDVVPTTKQKICMFSCVVWARIWLLTAPFIGVLTFLHNLFPLAAFGFIELCGGICSCVVDHIHNIKKHTIYQNSNVMFKDGDNQGVTITHM